MKTINIEITGEDIMINSGIEAYAKRYGWTEKDNETALQATERIFKDHFKNAISEYKSNEVAMTAKEQFCMEIDAFGLTATELK